MVIKYDLLFFKTKMVFIYRRFCALCELMIMTKQKNINSRLKRD